MIKKWISIWNNKIIKNTMNYCQLLIVWGYKRETVNIKCPNNAEMVCGAEWELMRMYTLVLWLNVGCTVFDAKHIYKQSEIRVINCSFSY